MEKKIDRLTMGIVGAGTMGKGVAQVAALSGIHVLLFDTDQNATLNALDFIKNMLKKSVEKGKLADTEADKALSLTPKMQLD